ncbi:MAG: MMPL family transporter [Solirubrobacterales bacterium]|nr:MMPL family transporter [Solirubrobacterales bacterium]
MFEEIAHRAYLHRGRWVAISVLGVFGAVVIAAGVFDAVKPFGFRDPDSESSRAFNRLEDASGEKALPGVLLLVEPQARVASADGRRAIQRTARELARIEGIARVVTPAPHGALTSENGRLALVEGFLEASEDDPSEVGDRVLSTFENRPGVEAGGEAVASSQLNQTTEDDLRRIELFAAPILFLLSLLIFRGLVAATLPLIVGATSIILTLFMLKLLTGIVEIDVFAINIVTGLGLGLAIDYSLFVVSRYREEIDRQGATGAALRSTMAAVGPMVGFSGLTVAVALVSLVVFPQRFLYSIGIGGALVALLSALVVVTVLPALLALLGDRVNALAPPGLQRRTGSRRWYRFARAVMRHPLPVVTIVAAVMIVAGLPFLRVALTRADSRVLPADASARQVDVVIKSKFAANPSDQIVVVLDTQGSASAGSPQAAGRELVGDEAVAVVLAPRPVDGVSRVDGELSAEPYSDRALDAVQRARSLDWGSPALVGGPSAELADQGASLSSHLPLAMAIIVLSTLTILFVMTRSVTLPLAALLMNFLTVSVAFGVLVLIFQDGRFEEVLDYMSGGALDTSMPILLFAVTFGLSTDYGVFLLQRIKEAREAGADDAQAVALGLERSGRIITAAALLFAVAMGAFVFSDLIYIKQVAVGTAVAVLVDATLVRGLLFPALMRLLGPWAWWAPRRMRRDAPPKKSVASS